MIQLKQITLLLFISGFAFSSCKNDSLKEDNSVVVSDGNAETPTAETESESKPKTNQEIVKEVATIAVDLTKTIIKTIKINDSIKMANREQMFAYQIGLPIREKDEVFEAYKKLPNMQSIYVLELRKEYYLIKYEGKSKSELEEGLEVVKAELSASVTGAIQIKNLMELCSKKDKLIIGDNITKRKEDVELPCLICK